MTKVLTLVQASWLVIQLCGRAVEHLPTTTLELSTAGIVLCTFGTFVCWLRKPSDVQRGVTITTSASTTQILLDAGDAAAVPYRHTPLDFVAKESFTCSYDVMGWFNMRCDSLERPTRATTYLSQRSLPRHIDFREVRTVLHDVSLRFLPPHRMEFCLSYPGRAVSMAHM